MLLLALAALFWSTWPNLQRADRKWRFELYALDFAFGALISAALLAITTGNAGSSNTFTFDDTLTVASKRNMAFAAGGGVVYCLGNLMVFAGVVLAGLSTAVPVGASMGLIAGVLTVALNRGTASPGMTYGGVALALAAVIAAAFAQKQAAAAAPVKKGMHPGWKGFVLSCAGGPIAGLGIPISDSGRQGDIGVGAYGVAVFMALGLFAMTPLVMLYFLNLPVQGDAASPLGYLKGTRKQHLMGFLGGTMWGIGTTAFFASASGGFAGSPAFLQCIAVVFGGSVIGALSGLFLWGEHAGAPKARVALMGSMALLALASGMVFSGS